MTAALNPATITRLEKAAADNGFDQELPREGDWLAFASTQAPLRLWLTAGGDSVFVAGLSQANVARSLELGTTHTGVVPAGAAGARAVADIPMLHRLVRRAFQLSRTLPDELLHVFEKKVAALPRETDVERLVVQRVGQDVFRAGLLDYWESRCAVTGLAIPELLRASHAKPWADCTTDAERLDVFNGLLLAPHLDVLFDRGFVSFANDGALVLSNELGPQDRDALGLASSLHVRALAEGHLPYLRWHRERIFRDSRAQKAAPGGSRT